jgi:endonuclease/exonuclease/phosphatase family metal-dependent hydrolase
LDRSDLPTIVVGDFNLLPQTKSVKMMETKLVNLIKKYKIKSTRPGDDVIMDYIFVNDKIKVKNFQVINNKISDHFPLLLDFNV